MATVVGGVVSGNTPRRIPMVLFFVMVAKVQKIDGRRPLSQERKAYDKLHGCSGERIDGIRGTVLA